MKSVNVFRITEDEVYGTLFNYVELYLSGEVRMNIDKPMIYYKAMLHLLHIYIHDELRGAKIST